jgi:hypothetical protein
MLLLPAHKQMLHRLQRMRQRREEKPGSANLMLKMRSSVGWATPRTRLSQMSYWFPRLFGINYEPAVPKTSAWANWFENIAA